MNYLNINLGAFGIIATILAIAATVVAFCDDRTGEQSG